MEDSSLGRLISVLISPEKTFRSIAEHPTWVVALVVLVLLGAAAGYLVFQKLDMAEVISQSAPLGYLLFALVFWVVFKLQGGEFDYRTSLSVTLHGLMPTAVYSLLSLPVIYSRQTIGIEESQRGVLFSNLAPLAPEEAGTALTALLASIDLFTIWCLVLFAIGYSIVGRVSKTSAGVTVVLLWIVYVVIKVGMMSIRG
jgi:hypothetical protein